MKLANLKVGTRLTLGFGIVILLLIATTGLGIVDLRASDQSIDLIVKDRYPKVAIANNALSEINAISIAMRNTLILDHDAQIQEQLEEIVASRKNIDGYFAQLEKLLVAPKERELFGEIIAARDKYRSGQGEFIGMIEEGKKADAASLMLNTLIRTQHAYIGELKKLIALGASLMDQASGDAAKQYRQGVISMLALCGAAMLIASGFAFWVTRSITRPLHFAVRVAQTVADGNLTSRIDVRTTDETGQLLKALKEMNDSLVHIVNDVRSGTETMVTASNQIAAGNQDLSSRTEEQASSLEETASSLEELASTAKQNADNARQANQLARSASGVAISGGEVVHQVVSTMGSINESSRKIVDIISVIDGIAFQTNILALNAAVEAARAGEQGRGFAVVASEVRNLAQRSAAAAKEIKTLIDDSVIKVQTGSELVDQAGERMNEVVASIKRVTDIMGEITTASNEQSAGIDQINQAISQMDQVTQQNAALVEEATAASESLLSQAGGLSQTVSVFTTDTVNQSPSGASTAVVSLAQGIDTRSRMAVAVPAAMPARMPAQRRELAETAVRSKAGAADEWDDF
jgi:methyl-accepting chemotaxis protein